MQADGSRMISGSTAVVIDDCDKPKSLRVSGTVIAAVLAGGAGKRFGGGKTTACGPLVAAALHRMLLPVFTVGAQVGISPIVADWPTTGLGPLGALCGAMRYASTHGFAEILTVPCDALPLPLDLLAQLGAPSPVVADGNHLIGLWPTTLAAMLEAHLAKSQDRSMARWCAVSAAARKDVTGIGNINTRAEFDLYCGGLDQSV